MPPKWLQPGVWHASSVWRRPTSTERPGRHVMWWVGIKWCVLRLASLPAATRAALPRPAVAGMPGCRRWAWGGVVMLTGADSLGGSSAGGYIVSSCSRTIHGLGGQFGPNILPIRSKVLPGNLCICSRFDCNASSNRYGPDTRRPLPYKLRLRTNRTGKLGLASVFAEVFRELHTLSISASLNYTQAINEARRSFLFLSGSLLIQP